MVLPVTGPITQEINNPYYTSHWYRKGYRQKKPYNLSTAPFEHRKVSHVLSSPYRFVFFNSKQLGEWMVLNEVHSLTNNEHKNCDNGTYAKFIGKLKAQNASLGVTLGEHKSARDMMTARSKQLLDLTKALIRRDFSKAYRIATKEFKTPSTKWHPPEQTRWHSPSFSSLYLEWSWGWRPMIEDIGNALETLVDPVTPTYVRASNKYTQEYTSYYSNTAGGPGGNPLTYWRKVAEEKWLYTYRSSTGASVEVTNYNMSLANRLGVLNIPQILWATYPFSFIVDKYLNIGQMIGSLTDLYGFTLSQTWTSRHMKLIANGTFTEYRALAIPANSPTYIYDYYKVIGDGTVKKRIGGLLGPTLALRTPSIGSFSEAASYFALLHQLLSKER